MGSCIYCGKPASRRSGDGDHVVPAALGHFKYDLRFYGICRRCNTAIGVFEESLIRCSPEALIKNMIRPATQRRRSSRFGKGARGKPGPRTFVERDGFELLAWWDTESAKSLVCPEQIVLKDTQGRFYHLLLVPTITEDGLRRKVESIEAKLADDGYLSCDEQNSERYMDLFRRIKPKAKHTSRESLGIGEYRVAASTEFVMDDDYYRAIAKIAFHYYLLNSPRGYRGSEQVFEPVRKFVMGSGDRSRFFVTPQKFLTPFAKLENGIVAPSRWNHVLAGEESRTLAVVSVTLFVGPEFIPRTHEIHLATLDSKLLVEEPAFGHTYHYYPEQDRRGYAGYVERTPPIRLR